MNYQKLYNTIINRRLHTPFDGYTEKHHIIPKSLGGSDDASNLVSLSAREHYICHYLLLHIHKGDDFAYAKMVKAFLMMLVNSTKHQRYSPSKKYEKLRVEFAKAQSVNQTGKLNSQFGSRWIHSMTLKQSKKIAVTDTIPDGWSIGRVINFDKRLRHTLAKENKSIKKNKPKIDRIPVSVDDKISQLREWYTIYSNVGFEQFVIETGYKYSKPNLVQSFSRWLPEFVPQNGKKR